MKQGQIIATVGNTATFEIADQSHLHFEIKKSQKGDFINPREYLFGNKEV